MTQPASQLLTTIFNQFTPPEQRIRPAHPAWAGAVAWHAPTHDGITVHGWAHLPPGSRGTVLVLHPFTCHSMSPWIVEQAAHFRDTLQMATLGVDLRFHGRSGNGFPTFGTAEMWDVQAALTWAAANGFPPPFILWGESLGAMAAARTAISDARVHAAFLKCPPAWPARVLTDIFQMVGSPSWELINAAYGWNIVQDGDLRAHPPDPPHQPLICYAMGACDHHDIRQTQAVYRHWYNDGRGSFEVWPGDNPTHRKWFITIPGAPHEFDGHGFPVLDQLIERFMGYVLSAWRRYDSLGGVQ